MLNKCPYCGSSRFAKIQDENPNIKYVLTQVDVPAKAFLATSGLPVDAYGCADCNGITLFNETLKFHQ